MSTRLAMGTDKNVGSEVRLPGFRSWCELGQVFNFFALL